MLRIIGLLILAALALGAIGLNVYAILYGTATYGYLGLVAGLVSLYKLYNYWKGTS